MNISLILKIVITFFKIGIISFGGGYAAIPHVIKQVVEVNGWMTLEEFSDVLAIDEITPGPIAINCATFVGTKMAGLPGAIAATFGNVLPCFIIVLILIKFYNKYHNLSYFEGALSGLRCMVVALITSVAIDMFKSAIWAQRDITLANVDYVSLVLFIIGLFVLRKFKVDPVYVTLGCGIIGLIIFAFIG